MTYHPDDDTTTQRDSGEGCKRQCVPSSRDYPSSSEPSTLIHLSFRNELVVYISLNTVLSSRQ
eukprot:scaffold13358_cov198-Alexandrium_tamarense.AAC.7